LTKPDLGSKESAILPLAIMSLVFLVSITAPMISFSEAQQVQNVKGFKLVLNNFGYNSTKGGPDLVVNQGDTVRIILTSVVTTNHDFILDAKSPSPYNVTSNRISGSATTSVEFVATSAGTFKYYCNVSPTHRERGLEGNFIVNAVAAQPVVPPNPAPAPGPQPQQPEPAPAPAPTPEYSSGIDLTLAAGIAAIIVVIGVVVTLMRGRKKPKEMPES